MNETLRRDAEQIVRRAISSVKPDEAVRRALAEATFPGRVFLVAVGKAAWQMASAAVECLETPVQDGVVVTKYEHVMSPIQGIRCYEAGLTIELAEEYLQEILFAHDERYFEENRSKWGGGLMVMLKELAELPTK